MLVGAALAVLVLLLFLRHGRVTAISGASIPLTLAITVFVMSVLGQTFNLMTLGAMAIAIGLVIDDADRDRHRPERHQVEGLPQDARSEEHTSELQSQSNLVCRLLL